MTKYVKIKENRTLEYAPRNNQGVSNWINDKEAVLEAGYLPLEEIETPENSYVTGYTIDGNKIVPVFSTLPKPLPPTKEEQRQARAEAYRQEKDPITCQINSLRDEEQTPEVIAEIASLVEERKAKVAEIKARYPYPVEESEVIEDGLQREETEVEETSEPVIELYSMEI